MDLTNIKKGSFIKYKGESNVYYTKNKEYEVIDDGVTSIYILTNPGYPTHLNTIDDLSIWELASSLNTVGVSASVIRAATIKAFDRCPIASRLNEEEELKVVQKQPLEVTKYADIDFEDLANNFDKPMNNKDIFNLLGRK